MGCIPNQKKEDSDETRTGADPGVAQTQATTLETALKARLIAAAVCDAECDLKIKSLTTTSSKTAIPDKNDPSKVVAFDVSVKGTIEWDCLPKPKKESGEGSSGGAAQKMDLGASLGDSSSFLANEVAEARSLLMGVLGRLAVLGRVASAVSPREADNSGINLDSFIDLLEPIPDHDETDARVFAYVARARGRVYVSPGARERAFEALRATEQGDRCLMPQGGSFDVQERDLSSGLLDDDGRPVWSQEGDVRLCDNRKCGKLQARREGSCNKLGANLWAKSVRYSFAICKPAPNEYCIEYWRPYARASFYKGPCCTNEISSSLVYGWLCAGGLQLV